MESWIIIVITVAVVLVLREFWTWYMKINKLVSYQREQIKLLRDIRNLLGYEEKMKEQKEKEANLSSTEILHKTTPKDHPNFKAEELKRLKRLFDNDEISAAEYTRRQKEFLK